MKKKEASSYEKAKARLRQELMDRRTLKLLGYEVEPTDVVIQIRTQNENYPEATWLDYVTLKDQVDCDLAVAKVANSPSKFRLVWFSSQLVGPDPSNQSHYTRGVLIPREQFLQELQDTDCEVD